MITYQSMWHCSIWWPGNCWRIITHALTKKSFAMFVQVWGELFPVVSSSAPPSHVLWSVEIQASGPVVWAEFGHTHSSIWGQKVNKDKKTKGQTKTKGQSGSGAIWILNMHFAEMEFFIKLCVFLLLVRFTVAMQCSALEIQQLLGDYSEACTHYFASAVLLTARLADLHVAYNRSLLLINQV